MDNRNQWEYDYSNLYRSGGQQPEDTGYVNVGSSGTNTANQYNTPGPDPATPYGGVQFSGRQAQPGGGYAGGGTVPPQYGQPAGRSQPAPKKKGGLARRALSLALALAVGFGGGMLGSWCMLRATGGSRVVVQSVQRDTSNAISNTSTDGHDLSLTEVSSLVTPSVVVITTEEMVTAGSWFGQSEVVSGAGSGVVMSSDGYIMTCAHVVSGASHITVTIGDQSYDAEIIGEDTESDIAVVKIAADGLTSVVMGDSDALVVGEEVVAVGNPLGELGGTVTNGIVSALNRDVVVEDQEMSLIQTNASVSPGNSGGGLFNMAGELIGIVNAKSSDENAEGLGFAIPINTAFKVAQDLIENGYVSGRPAMGITVITVNDESMAAMYNVTAYGVYVYAVENGSPAQQAGLQSGDRILSIDDREVTQSSDLTGYIAERQVGDTVSLSIARGGQILTVNVTLGEKGSTSAQTQTPGRNR